MFVAKLEKFQTQEISLWTSFNFYKDLEFKQADIPAKRLEDKSYTILDSEEYQIFLHVNHEADDDW